MTTLIDTALPEIAIDFEPNYEDVVEFVRVSETPDTNLVLDIPDFDDFQGGDYLSFIEAM